jgi:hypothetical protein
LDDRGDQPAASPGERLGLVVRISPRMVIKNRQPVYQVEVD